MDARTAIGVVAVGVLAAGSYVVGVPAASAAARPESLTQLSTFSSPVTSSTGQHLMISLTAARFAGNTSHPDTNRPGTVSITVSTPRHKESHTWSFPVSGGTFATNADGTGSIKTGSQLGPYGNITLAVHGSSKHTRSCGTGNFQVVHHANLKGSVTFNTTSTGPHAWGTVTSKGLVFPHARVRGSHGDDAEEACAGPFNCFAGVSWQASHGEVTLSGFAYAGHRKGELDADRFVKLNTPSGATRSDDVSLHSQPLLLHDAKHPTLTIESAGKFARGAATITAKGHSPYEQGCSRGRTQKGRIYNGLYNIADVGLSIKARIFGRLELSTVRNASFTVTHIA
jgi:hypothetical protein